MTTTGPSAPLLDRARVRELFDLRSSYNARNGGDFEEDPYPRWHHLRETGPVHEGTPHALTGYHGDAMFQGLPEPDRPHFTVFSYEDCSAVFRDQEVFVSHPELADRGDDITVASGLHRSMLSMNRAVHRRYRSLVQPNFVPSFGQWWISRWIEETVERLVDGFAADGRAELNVDFCAAIPVLTITGSFGVPVEQALTIREALNDPAALLAQLAPIVAARRENPADDLIGTLVRAEYTEDGTAHRLTDEEILSFAHLLLAAGSGTTWKQMGIALTALLQRPALLAAVREDRSLLVPVIEEALRWMPTDPAFARWVARDTELRGVPLPRGAVLHLCLGAANRDPARWQRPDEFDATRPRRASLAFGGGVHICLGMHVARAEMTVGINALLDRLPGLRLDPDAAPPRFIGMYERGATEIPAVWD